MTTAGPSGGRGGDPTSRAAVLAAAIALLGFGPATAQEAGGERGNATGGNPAAAQAADRELPPVNARRRGSSTSRSSACRSSSTLAGW